MLFQMKHPQTGSLKLVSVEPNSTQPQLAGQHRPPPHSEPKE